MLEIFKERLNQMINTSGLSEEVFAKRIGVSRSTLRNYRDARSDMNTEKLYDICVEFEQSADYLLGLSDDEMLSLTGLTKEQKKRLREAASNYRKANKLL